MWMFQQEEQEKEGQIQEEIEVDSFLFL